MADVEFANQTLLALANPSQGLAIFNRSKQGIYQLRQTQQYLVGATRFVVANSLLRHAVKAMFLPPDVLLNAARMAVPPFENMWIEWDSNLQRDLMKQEWEARGVEYNNDPEGGLSRVGYSIVNLKGINMYNMYGLSHDDGKIYHPAHGFYMANEDVMDADGFVTRRNSRQTSGLPDVTAEEFRDQQVQLGSAYLSQHYVGLFDEPKYAEPMLRLFQRFALGTHQIGELLDPNITVMQDMVRSNKMVNQSLSMFSGDARLLWTILAMVNYPHHVFQREITKGFDRVLYGRRVPRNEVRVLEIDLPKPRGVKRYERMFKGGGGPKRQHVRRGHWRFFHHKDGRVTQRWIAEQTVGNAALGVIDHEYKLMTKGVK